MISLFMAVLMLRLGRLRAAREHTRVSRGAWWWWWLRRWLGIPCTGRSAQVLGLVIKEIIVARAQVSVERVKVAGLRTQRAVEHVSVSAKGVEASRRKRAHLLDAVANAGQLIGEVLPASVRGVLRSAHTRARQAGERGRGGRVHRFEGRSAQSRTQ